MKCVANPALYDFTSEEFKEALAVLPVPFNANTAADVKAYDDFRSAWGMFVVTKTYAGGRIINEVSVSSYSELTTTYSSSTVRAYAKAGLFGIGAEAGGVLVSVRHGVPSWGRGWTGRGSLR